MSQVKLDTDRLPRLLLLDAVPTLGERAVAEVSRLVANYQYLAAEWVRAGESPESAQRDFDQAIVDGLQEAAHDLFWDTTWPTCPKHPNHPLQYDEKRELWQCPRDSTVAVPVGKLSGLYPPAT